MVTYALDIENQRILHAMEELGISKEELQIKTFEDFAGTHVSSEIQKLRYDHYTKLLRNTVTDIRELLKRRHITILPSESKAGVTSSIQEGTISQKFPQNSLDKFPFKQRAILLTTISSFEAEKPTQKKLVKPRSEPNILALSGGKNLQQAFKKYKDIQTENLKKIQKDQQKYQINLSAKMMNSMKDHIGREQAIEERKKLAAREKEEIYAKKYDEIIRKKQRQEEVMEDDIAVKLQKFEDKIQRSEALHSDFLKEKIDKTLKLREISETVLRNQMELKKTNEVEQLQRIVDKQQFVKTVRERKDEFQHKLALDKKNLFEKKRQTALEVIKKAEKEFVENSKKAEKRFFSAQQVVSERKERMNHEIEVKKEMKRLKDYEGFVKIQRTKRMFVRNIQDNKMNKHLKKQIIKYQKIDEFKMMREKEIYSMRESAIKAMIEKEKLQEAVALIWKSPRSKTAQEKLKSLKIYSKETSIVEAEENH